MKTTNKILAIILAILMMGSIIPITASGADATSGACGENLTWNFDKSTGTLSITGTGAMTDWSAGWKVPWGTYDSKILKIEIDEGVTNIGDWSFWLCKNITELDIPDSVTRIGDYAIGACYKLNNVTIPDGVTTIGYEAFASCRSFTAVTFPDSVVSIGARAFEGCEKLTEVFIPEGIEQIGNSAFSSCDILTKITVDENNPYYSSDEYGVLFNKDKTTIMQYPCGRTETSYVIPDGVESIEGHTFYECDNLKDVSIPASVTTIDEYAFYDFTTILHYGGTEEQWKQLLADNSEAAERLAYFTVHCSDNSIYPSGTCGENLIWMFDISTGTLTISGEGHMANFEYDDVYGGCDRPWEIFNYNYIKNVVIDDGVLSVGYEAFCYCYNLESVLIGSTVTYIEDYAFNGCDALTDVYYFGTETEWDAIHIGTWNTDLTDANIHFQMQEDVLVSGVCGDNLTWTLNTTTGNMIISGYGEMYDNPTWDGYKDKITSVIIEDCKETWGDFVISSGVTSIGEGAFSGCKKLKNITIPDTVTTIGISAFYGCTNLKRITIPDSVTTVGDNAFEDCTNLEKVVLGSGITTIEDGTFDGCSNLKTVTMTVNVTAIDSFAFYGCGNLEDVYYTGTEEDWNKIAIGIFNTGLDKATIHYAYLECKHDYKRYVTPPTCTKQGYTWYLCSLCGDYYTDEYVDPTGHTYDSGVVTEPTCNSSGFTKYTCIVCDNFYRDNYVNALGHKYETVVTEPTCEEEGYTTYTCTVCDYSYTGDNTEATGHNVDSWEVTAQPMCAKKGTATGVCLDCGEEVTQSIPALGHNYGELKIDYDATCTSVGRKSKECSRCGSKTGFVTIPAKGHTYGDWIVIIEPTCTTYGQKRRYCLYCDRNETTSAIGGHNYSIENNVVEATCTTDGSKTLECSLCGNTKNEVIPATGHNYTSEITTPATHLTTGVEIFTCTCGDTYTEVIEKIAGHTYEAVVTEPTCTEQGYTTYTCECGDSYFDKYVYAKGHNYTSEITTPATHLTTGVEIFTCTNCNDSYTEVIEKLADHTYEAVVTAPTCTEQGYTTYTCECGNSYIVDYVDATGHTEETIPAVAPTCTESGLTEGAECSACGETFTEQKELPATGHSPANAVEDNYVAPTCTSNGSVDKVVYCSVCNEELSRETVTLEATGHADNDGNGYCDADNELLDPTVECDCNCHKSGIKKFFFKFALFFQRIFGANKTCDCGVAHY